MATFHHTTRQGGYHQHLQRLLNSPVWHDRSLIQAGLPYAAETRRPYTGINVLLLWLAASSDPLTTAWRVRPIYGPAGGMNQLRTADGLVVRWVKCSDRSRIVTRFVERAGAISLPRPPVPAQIPDGEALRTALLPYVKGALAKLQQDEPRRWARLHTIEAQAITLITEIAAAFCAAGWDGGERLVVSNSKNINLNYRVLPVIAGCAQKVSEALHTALLQGAFGDINHKRVDNSSDSPSSSDARTDNTSSHQSGPAQHSESTSKVCDTPEAQHSTEQLEEARRIGAACRSALERLQLGYAGVTEHEWDKLLRMQARATLYRYRTPKVIRLVMGAKYAKRARHGERLSVAGVFHLWGEGRRAKNLSIFKREYMDGVVPGIYLNRLNKLPYWWSTGQPYNVNRSHSNQRSFWRGVNRRLRRTRLPEPPTPDWSSPSWEELADKLVVPGCYTKQGRRKRDGSVRWLQVPSVELAKVQRVISALVMKSIRPTINACAFLPRRSILPHVYAHAGAQVAIVCDIKDFFGSVRLEQIRCALEMRRSPFPPESHGAILRLVTWADGSEPAGLPQGAPSSPAFANWVAFLFDWRVQRDLEEAFGVGVAQYTRYADDLVLSSTAQVADFAERALEIVRRCVCRMGWWLNPKKTRTWTSVDGPLQICGLNVPRAIGEAITLPRAWKRRLRVALHQLRKSPPNEKGDPKSLRAARGTVAYAYAVTGDARLLADCAARVGQIAEALRLNADAFREGWRDL